MIHQHAQRCEELSFEREPDAKGKEDCGLCVRTIAAAVYAALLYPVGQGRRRAV